MALQETSTQGRKKQIMAIPAPAGLARMENLLDLLTILLTCIFIYPPANSRRTHQVTAIGSKYAQLRTGLQAIIPDYHKSIILPAVFCCFSAFDITAFLQCNSTIMEVSMNLVDRVKNILLTPAREWEVIKAEPLTTGQMFTQYAMILAAIPIIAGFIGRSIIGYSVLGFHTRISIVNGLIWAILYYIFTLIGVYVLGLIIDLLAPSFGAKKDMNGSLKVAIFSSTASWIAGIFALIPPLSLLSILGLYSLYLLYVGMKSLKEPPADKLVGYYVVTLIVGIAVYLIIGFVVGAIALSGYPHAGMM